MISRGHLTVAVSDVLELGNRRRDLQAHVENLLLALKADVCGPSDHARNVALGLNVLADAIVAGALFDKRVLTVSKLAAPASSSRTYLGGLLATTSLALREGGRCRFLSFGSHLEVSRLS